MEIRKIQITGGSSFMITLPKDWAESAGLKKNDPIGMTPQSDGSLILYPGGEEAASEGSTKIVDVDGIGDRDLLYRMLVGAYIAGHSSILLRSSTILSSTAASVASSFAQTAMGLEIMEENDSSILIKDLMDQKEMKPSKSIERMKVLVRNMLNDVMDGLEKKDESLLTGMDDRDRDVDRIDWLISRQVNIHQKDVTISRRMGLDLCEITRAGSISRALERIGDHAVLLAKNLRPLLDDPAGLDKSIQETGRSVISLMVDSVGTWSDRDMIKANECIERGETLVFRANEIGELADELPDKTALAAELIAGSVKRIAEYSMDISEIAINAVMDQ